MDIIIILGYLLLAYLFRAIVTKYFLLYLSISPLSLFQLLKKYIFITLIIITPLVLLAFSSVFLIDNNWISLDFIETLFNKDYIANLFLFCFYLLEAIFITLIIKDADNNKISFKIAIILVSIFFILDSVIDMSIPETYLYNDDINLTIENNISNTKINK